MAKIFKRRMRVWNSMRTFFGGITFMCFIFGALVVENSWKLSVALMVLAVISIMAADKAHEKEMEYRTKLRMLRRKNERTRLLGA